MIVKKSFCSKTFIKKGFNGKKMSNENESFVNFISVFPTGIGFVSDLKLL